MDQKIQINKQLSPLTYQQAKDTIQENLWDQLQGVTIEQALQAWLPNLKKNTREAYQFAFRVLFREGILPSDMTLQTFSLCSVNNILDSILVKVGGSRATKQARAAAFISFTRHLNRQTEGMIKMACPERHGTNKTYLVIRDKAKTEALSRSQWMRFLHALKDTNYRNYLIAKMILQGGRRCSEVLESKIEDIDFEKNIIRFRVSKSLQVEKYAYVTYPEDYMKELRYYLEDKSFLDHEKFGLVFSTVKRTPICRIVLMRSFIRAGEAADLPIKVTPHVLRATYITYLKKQGYRESDIAKITGHSSVKLIEYYDKTNSEENISKEVSLI